MRSLRLLCDDISLSFFHFLSAFLHCFLISLVILFCQSIVLGFATLILKGAMESRIWEHVLLKLLTRSFTEGWTEDGGGEVDTGKACWNFWPELGLKDREREDLGG